MLTFAYEGGGGVKGFAYVIIFWKNFALETTKKSQKTVKNLKFFVKKPNNVFANNLYLEIMKFSSQSTIVLLNLWGGPKMLRNTYGGSCQMLTFDDRRGGGGSEIPKTRLRNTWMFPWESDSRMAHVLGSKRIML